MSAETPTPPPSVAEPKAVRAATSKSKRPRATAQKDTLGNGRAQPPGVIEPGSLLTAEEARARLRLGAWAWRSLRRCGLRTVRAAGRSYVLADDLIAFFGQQVHDQNQGEDHGS